MDWVHEYVPGQVRASCSICGCSRRFPDNLTYCVDKLFRCERCMETTAMELDQRIQAYRMQPDEPDSRVGLTPFDDVPSTFLADAQARRAVALPGWTPTTTFYDDFTVVPGGVGSSWTVTLIGSGTVALSSAGVARFTGAVGSSARASAASVSVPDPSAGNFYCSFRAKMVALGHANAGASNGSSANDVVGSRTTTNSAFFMLTLTATQLSTTAMPVELDVAGYHIFEIWWKQGGAVTASVDGCSYVRASIPSISTRNPVINAALGGSMDISDYVAFV